MGNITKIRVEQIINYETPQKITKMKTRTEVEAKQFSIKMKIAKLKKKSFINVGAENKFYEENIRPLQIELTELMETWGKLPY